jgi:glutamate---cysteine ligase / carboxylate-amine ligase
LVDFGRGAVVPFAELMEELLELIAEDAEALGCTAEVAHARHIVKEGTSADRQLARFEAVKALGGSEDAALVSVVDGIIDDTMILPKA